MKRMIRSAEDFSKWIHSTEWTTLPDTNRIEKRVYGKRQMNYAELLKMRVIPETKVCRACKMELPSDAFNKAPSNKDGLQSMCRECTKKYDAMRRLNKPFFIKTIYLRRAVWIETLSAPKKANIVIPQGNPKTRAAVGAVAIPTNADIVSVGL